VLTKPLKSSRTKTNQQSEACEEGSESKGTPFIAGYLGNIQREPGVLKKK
jgi:hypothetical protein